MADKLGYDAGKKTVGRKRHIAMLTDGSDGAIRKGRPLIKR